MAVRFPGHHARPSAAPRPDDAAVTSGLSWMPSRGAWGRAHTRTHAHGRTHTRLCTRPRAHVPHPQCLCWAWLCRLLGNFELSLNHRGTRHRRDTVSLRGTATPRGPWDCPLVLSAIRTLQQPWGVECFLRTPHAWYEEQGTSPQRRAQGTGAPVWGSRGQGRSWPPGLQQQAHMTRTPHVALWMGRGLSTCCRP